MAPLVVPCAALYHQGIDVLPLDYQYRLLYDLPGGYFLAPKAKLRMYRDDVPGSYALAAIESAMRPPGVDSLPRQFLYKSSLIDFDYWAEVNEGLRNQGSKLPCDYEFGQVSFQSAMTDSDQTITAAAAMGTRLQGKTEPQRQPLTGEARQMPDVADDVGPVTLQTPGTLRLLVDYGQMAFQMMGKCLTGGI